MGAPDVAQDFNPESFINANDFKDFDSLIARIKEVDENPEIYRKIITAPIFASRWDTKEKMLEHLKNVTERIMALRIKE